MAGISANAFHTANIRKRPPCFGAHRREKLLFEPRLSTGIVAKRCFAFILTLLCVARSLRYLIPGQKLHL